QIRMNVWDHDVLGDSQRVRVGGGAVECVPDEHGQHLMMWVPKIHKRFNDAGACAVEPSTKNTALGCNRVHRKSHGFKEEPRFIAEVVADQAYIDASAPGNRTQRCSRVTPLGKHG